MTKHCTNPEIWALQDIAYWIEDSSQDLSNWLTNAPLWVILNAAGVKVARINSSHQLWEVLDDESRDKELFGKKKNYLMWFGKIEDWKPIEVTHFGPFGEEKILKKGFGAELNRQKKMFLDGLEHIGIKSLEDLDGEGKTRLSRRYFEYIGPLLEEYIDKLVNHRALLVGIKNMTGPDGIKILVKFGLTEKLAKMIIKDVVSKRVASGLAKKIPAGLGFLAGIGFGIGRFCHGEIVGGLLEMGSGLLGTLPGPGTAFSLGIDVGLLAFDIKGRVNAELEKQISEKKKNFKVIKDAMAKNKSYCYEDVFKAAESFMVA